MQIYNIPHQTYVTKSPTQISITAAAVPPLLLEAYPTLLTPLEKMNATYFNSINYNATNAQHLKGPLPGDDTELLYF